MRPPNFTNANLEELTIELASVLRINFTGAELRGTAISENTRRNGAIGLENARLEQAKI